MSEVKRCMAVSASRTFGDGNLVVAASDYDALATEIERLRARLAGVIGYCAQEGHDGEPYDTINAIATGEFDPCGSRTADQPSAAPCDHREGIAWASDRATGFRCSKCGDTWETQIKEADQARTGKRTTP